MDRKTVLDKLGCTDEERTAVAKAIDKMNQSEQRNIPTATSFLSPRECDLSKRAIEMLGREEGVLIWGGYYGAERNVISFLPDYMDETDFTCGENCPVSAVRCEFFGSSKLTHRDFLGSLMGLGLARETVGDILIGDGSCDIMLLPTVRDFVAENFLTAGRVGLKRSVIDVLDVNMPLARVEEIRDTVSSLRLDSVVSSGFKMSRAKASTLITAGRVELNWAMCQKSDRQVGQGDCITARGYGKIELESVGGLSKKGRTTVIIKRYI